MQKFKSKPLTAIRDLCDKLTLFESSKEKWCEAITQCLYFFYFIPQIYYQEEENDTPKTLDTDNHDDDDDFSTKWQQQWRLGLLW